MPGELLDPPGSRVPGLHLPWRPQLRATWNEGGFADGCRAWHAGGLVGPRCSSPGIKDRQQEGLKQAADRPRALPRIPESAMMDELQASPSSDSASTHRAKLGPSCPVMVPEKQSDVRGAQSWPSGSSKSCEDRVAHIPFEERGMGLCLLVQRPRQL